MGTIYFTAGLFENVLRIIKESHDCWDVANDLARIQNTIDYGSDYEAAELDDYLRGKYLRHHRTIGAIKHSHSRSNSKSLQPPQLPL